MANVSRGRVSASTFPQGMLVDDRAYQVERIAGRLTLVKGERAKRREISRPSTSQERSGKKSRRPGPFENNGLGGGLWPGVRPSCEMTVWWFSSSAKGLFGGGGVSRTAPLLATINALLQ